MQSPRSPSSETCRSSASLGERATTSRSTRVCLPTTRSARSRPSAGRSAVSTSGGVEDRIFLNNVSLGVYAQARPPARTPPPPRRGVRATARAGDVRLDGPAVDATVPCRRAADSCQRGAGREQRVHRRADSSRRARAARRRLSRPVRGARDSAPALDGAHGGAVSDRVGAPRCTRPSTVSPPSSRRRSSYASIRGRCGCSSRRRRRCRVGSTVRRSALRRRLRPRSPRVRGLRGSATRAARP